VETSTTKGLRMTAADEPAEGDQQLLLEAKAGSTRAFQALVERHMRRMYTIAFSFTGDHDGAEEIAQEVFVKVHASLGSFRGESEFATWLHRIATNISLNRVKQKKRQTARSVTLETAEDFLPVHDTHTESAEQRAHIERALHELPTLQRAVVILRHFDGLSTKQVGDILRCSEGTVKTHLFRGLKKLRTKLYYLHAEAR
jgi:RNA polymerase sigma-70 factor (ECF subfamily)